MPTSETGEKVTAAEKAATAKRTNAFTELGQLQQKGLNSQLGLACVELLGPGTVPGSTQLVKIYIPAQPLQYLEALAGLTIQVAQLSITCDSILDMLIKGETVTLEKFMTLCAEAAEQRTSLVRRAMLSQGAQQAANSGIIKPS